MNIIMNDENHFIEVQGTAEGVAFSADELQSMLKLGQHGIEQLIGMQKKALDLAIS